MIPKEEIQQVLQATDIVSLIDQQVPLKKTGKNFVGLCPFHSEKSPSFVVSSDRQNYHCYGCGVSGDAIRFLMETDGLRFMEAVEELASRAGIQLSLKTGIKPAEQEESEQHKCLREAKAFYKKSLSKAEGDSLIGRYIQERNLNEELITRFSLGFAPDKWDGVYEYLNQKKFQAEVQESVGLIKSKTKGGYYDFLRNRLVFPIRDIRGRVIGFAGRKLADDGPKYLNPPETELYKKSSVLYGMYEGKEALRRKRKAILVEGYMDVIRMHEGGFEEALAACGTALTQDHIQVLHRQFIKEVVLLFDGDQAGRAAAVKSARLCLESDMEASVCLLPEGLDPDDMIAENGSEALEQLIVSSPNVLEFLIRNAAEASKGKGLAGEKEAIIDLLQIYRNIHDPLKKDLLVSRVSHFFGIDKQTIMKELQQTPSQGLAPVSAPVVSIIPREVSFSKEEKREVDLVQYMLLHPQAIQWVKQYISPDELSHVWLKALLERLLQLEEEDFMELQPEEYAEVFIEFNHLIMHLLQIARKSTTDVYAEKKIRKIIYAFKKEKLNQRVLEIKQAERLGDHDQAKNLIKERIQLLSELKQLND